ncbi:YqaJ viral recombinase family protein [Corynebacterium sphenisci]|uniref:YqaJ viral recombinase family protein n=1 Tax=Corynebacterium sphenisci TaxID=191493 RepID=UPI0026DFAF76|nr:YqaJ viral recombinase family protein [Corynebacterium sphenisci]MDO5730819.1 YqaJ viral recombinase family protein [Corynebacterium sphenisci]
MTDTIDPDAFEVTTPDHGRFSIVHTTSRQEWKAARRAHLTATEVAMLAALRPADWERLRREKAGEEPGFGGNAATDWGHEREPHIIAHLAENADPTLRANDQLVVSLADPRFAGTPDAISEDGRTLGEAKTSNHPLAPEDRPQRYEDQAQWNLLVTGAQALVIGIEEHDDQQEIIGTRMGWIWPDPQRQAELIAIAERFLAGGNPVPATDDERLSEAIDEYSALRDMEKRIKAALKEKEPPLRELIGPDEGRWASRTWQIRQTAPTTTTRVDAKAVAADFPEVAEKCAVTSVTRGKLLAPTRIERGGK